jgi:hypothetical protein
MIIHLTEKVTANDAAKLLIRDAIQNKAYFATDDDGLDGLNDDEMTLKEKQAVYDALIKQADRTIKFLNVKK